MAINKEVVGQCTHGLLLLVGIHREDTVAEAKKMAEKIAGLRIFNDIEGKMNLSIRDIEPHFGDLKLHCIWRCPQTATAKLHGFSFI